MYSASHDPPPASASFAHVAPASVVTIMLEPHQIQSPPFTRTSPPPSTQPSGAVSTRHDVAAVLRLGDAARTVRRRARRRASTPRRAGGPSDPATRCSRTDSPRWVSYSVPASTSFQLVPAVASSSTCSARRSRTPRRARPGDGIGLHAPLRAVADAAVRLAVAHAARPRVHLRPGRAAIVRAPDLVVLAARFRATPSADRTDRR